MSKLLNFLWYVFWFITLPIHFAKEVEKLEGNKKYIIIIASITFSAIGMTGAENRFEEFGGWVILIFYIGGICILSTIKNTIPEFKNIIKVGSKEEEEEKVKVYWKWALELIGFAILTSFFGALYLFIKG